MLQRLRTVVVAPPQRFEFFPASKDDLTRWITDTWTALGARHELPVEK